MAKDTVVGIPMKRISVKLVGSATPPFTIDVTPGMTAGEILESLNLGDRVLAIPPAPNRYFAPDEQVFEELLEDDYLLAVANRAPAIAPDKVREDFSKLVAVAEGESIKTLVIRIYGSKRKPVHVRIRPGATISDVLCHLKIANFALVAEGAEDLAAAIFKQTTPSQEDLYGRVSDGDKFIALPPYEAARIALADALRNSPLKGSIR